MGPISGIRLPNPLEAIRDAAPAARTGGPGADFANAVRSALDKVDGLQKDSQASIHRMLSGEVEDLHKVALEHQRAALAFDLLLQVRNKAVQAYQEVMRMQV
ncbi:MAG: flagellar hook-basal body complex protein FliE [Bryobacteraceae bacterium]|nr:flagellar hook-basal body complex protein FliE [Bryobacteraceae bacterium]